MSVSDERLLVVELGGADYGWRGAKALRSLTTDPSGPGLVGTAQIELLAGGVSLYDFPDKTPVAIYSINSGATQIVARRFGGFTSIDDDSRLGKVGGSRLQKTWKLQAVDFNIQLQRLVLPADNDLKVYCRAPAGTFGAQVQWAIQTCQNPPGAIPLGGYPLQDIDFDNQNQWHVGSGSEGPPLDESVSFGGKSLGYILKQLCAAAHRADPSIDPEFFIGYDPLPGPIAGGFGVPVLYLYDRTVGALASPTNYYTDIAAHFGTLVPHASPKRYNSTRQLDRSRDGASLVDYRQGTRGNKIYTGVAPSGGYYLHNPLASDGRWRDEPTEIDLTSIALPAGATNDDISQAAIDENVAATGRPLESFDIVSETPSQPGDTVGVESERHLDTSLSTLNPDPTLSPSVRAWYVVKSASTSWAGKGKPIYTTMRLGARALLLGETPGDDTTLGYQGLTTANSSAQGTPWQQAVDSAVYAAYGDGDPVALARLVDTTNNVAITATNIGTTKARAVRFQLPRRLLPASLNLFPIGTLASTITFAIYRIGDGTKLWDSGAQSLTTNAWKSVAISGVTLDASEPYLFAVAANATSGTAIFRTLPLPYHADFYGASVGPLAGLAIGIPELVQFAVSAGAWPSSLPALEAINSWTGTLPHAWLVGSAS